MDDTKVGIRDLKTNLSKYMRLVKAGAVLVITERGRPIGRLLPYDPDSEDRLVDFVRSGLASWNGQALSPREPFAETHAGASVSDLLVEDRG